VRPYDDIILTVTHSNCLSETIINEWTTGTPGISDLSSELNNDEDEGDFRCFFNPSLGSVTIIVNSYYEDFPDIEKTDSYALTLIGEDFVPELMY